MSIKEKLPFFILSFFILLGSARAQETAERVYLNGRIWTGDQGSSRAEALAIRGDKLVAVGTNAQIRKLIGKETSVIDLNGHTVVPGFNDAHWHFAAATRADLVDSGNIKELQRRLAAWGKDHPTTAWVAGRGWGYTDFPDRIPHRKYLDEIFPDRPVFIWERDGHMGVANTAALRLAGVTKATPDPEHGRLERDAAGELTGELKESAVSLVTSHMPKPTADDYYEWMKDLMNKAASYGITSLQNASGGLSADEMAAVQRLLAEGGMKVRFYFSVPLLKDPTAEQLRPFKVLKATFRGPYVKFGSAKGILDGTVDAKTAAMFEPYVGGGIWAPIWTQDEINRAVAAYDREGFQVWLHAIGDKAINMALNAFENAAATNGTADKRHRVEHAEVPALTDFPRFKKLGVIASTQALFANPDATTLDNYAVLLGPQRASHANAFKMFDDAGAVQAFGSDHPVFSMEALKGIYCAVARITPEGTPKGGWYPKNRISVDAAVSHFTRDAAFASFDEKIKGTLSAGKLADFTVLSDDIFTGTSEKILKTKVLLTVMGGAVTYRNGM